MFGELRTIRRLGLVFLSGLVCIDSQAQTAAERVFGLVERSVVLIRDENSSGSGIVVSKDGLILTNLHVAGALESIKVTAKARAPGKDWQTLDFENAEFLSVHPSEDLALIRVKVPEGMELAPIRAPTAGQKPQTGSTCFAIGSPGAGEITLNNTITQGIVGAASRGIGGRDYIQFDAPINPGNSGGPLCSENGDLLGVVTFKVVDTEGLGFAIPVSRIDLKTFVKLKDRPRNMDEARRLIDLGNEYLARAQGSAGEEQRRLTEMAASLHRNAFFEAPGSADVCLELARIYRDIGRNDIARAFCAEGLKANPKHVWLHVLMGTLAQESLDAETAEGYFVFSLLNSEDSLATSIAAAGLAEKRVEEKRYAEAVYLLKWADSLAGPATDKDREKREELMDAAWPRLSGEEYKAFNQKQGGYSREEWARTFRKGEKLPKLASQSGKPKSEPAKELEPADGFALDEASQEWIAAALSESARIPDDGAVASLPDEVTQVKSACGGGLLVMEFRAYGKLGIYDTLRGRFAGFIPAEQDWLFAAGGNRLLIVRPKTKAMEVWDLPSMKKIGEGRLDVPGEIQALEMGAINGSRALIGYRMEERNQTYFALVRLPDGRMEFPEGGPLATNLERADVSVDGPADSFVIWSRESPTLGADYGTIEDGRWRLARIPRGGKFSTDGRLILGSREIYTTGGDLVEGLVSARALAPILGAGAYLHVDFHDATTVRSSETHEVLAEIPSGKLDMAAAGAFRGGVFDVASAYTGRIVEVSGKKITMLPLPPLAEAVSPKKAPPSQARLAAPGTEFRLTLSFDDPGSVVVEDAPEGVSWDAEKQVLIWKVPASERQGTREILISYRLDDGKTDYQIVRITVP